MKRAVTIDVSLCGVAVRGAPQLQLGQKVVVVMNHGGRIVPADCVVVRRMEASAWVGLDFVRMGPGPRRTLSAWVGERLASDAMAEHRGRTRLSPAREVPHEEVAERYKRGEAQKAIATDLAIGLSTVRRIVARRSLTPGG